MMTIDIANNNYYSVQNIEQLNKNLEDLLIKSQQLEIVNENLKKELKKYKDENTILKEQIRNELYIKNEKEIKIQELELRINEEKNKIKSLNKKIEEQSNKSNDLEKKLNEKKNEITRLSQNMQERFMQFKQEKSKLEEEKIKIEKEMKILNDTNQSVLYQNEELKRKIKEQENKKKEKDSKIKDLEKKQIEQENKIKEQTNIIEKKESTIKEIERKKKEKENTIREQLKKFEEQKNQINELDEKYKKFNGIINEFDKLSIENKELKKIKVEIVNIKKQKEQLENENKNLINNNRPRLEFFDGKANNFYDAVIEIDSINKLSTSGWKINYNEDRKEIYDKIVKEKTLKIGVLGLNNVGKSFILGLISRIIIPTGYSIETKGISIKYSEGEEKSDKGICLLDSAGFETPLLNDEISELENQEKEEIKGNYDDNLLYFQKIERISKDKAQTERFIEELIISLSDMLILVIGKLTRREQKLIDRIKKLVSEKEKTQFNSINIIHNLSHFSEMIEVENHIKNVLKKSATFTLEEIKVTGIPEYEDRIFYSEKDGTNHYIMARQGSEAGKYYNKMTIDLIKQKYNDAKSRRNINIPEEIIKLLTRLSKDITEEEIKIKNLEISEDKKTIKMKEGASQEIIECQQTFLDERGLYNSISRKFVPKCSSFAYKDKGRNILLIRLEIPGNIEKLTARFCYYGKRKTILIQGKKLEDDFPEKKKKSILHIKDNRNYEDINHYIELDNDIELIKEEALEKTGIYSFKFNTNNIDLSNKNEENNEDEDEEDELNNGKDEFKEIASGVYVLKFLITDTSMKNLYKKYKK